MFALLRFFLALFSSLFKSKSRLEAENAALRRQVIVLQRKVRGRVHFMNSDRLFLIQLYRWFPSVLKVITIIRPETVVRWHRAGFRRYESLQHEGLIFSWIVCVILSSFVRTCRQRALTAEFHPDRTSVG